MFFQYFSNSTKVLINTENVYQNFVNMSNERNNSLGMHLV